LEMIASEYLWKGLCYAKELSWFELNQKEPLSLWGWATPCFLLAKRDRSLVDVVCSSDTPYPSGHYDRLHCENRHVGNLARFEDWKYVVNTMGHPGHILGVTFQL
jgi:hypothetical protein